MAKKAVETAGTATITENRTLSTNYKPKKVLSNQQETLWSMIKPNNGVLCLWSEPGMAKTATVFHIARTKELLYIFLPVATMDETQLGIYPHVTTKKIVDPDTGATVEVPVVSSAIPEWAIKASNATKTINPETGVPYKGCMIDCSEINRANKYTRAAMLGVLNERRIGESFQFERDVYFVASANPGTEFEADIEEMNPAMASRFIHYTWNYSYWMWKRDYALDAGVHPWIIEYLDSYPGDFQDLSNLKNGQQGYAVSFANARTWTFLSDALNCCEDNNGAWNLLSLHASSYIGEVVATKIRDFIRSKMDITLMDLINGTKTRTVLDHTVQMRMVNELEFQVTAKEYNEFTDSNWDNLFVFLNLLDDERMVAACFAMVAKMPMNMIRSNKKGEETKFVKRLTDSKNKRIASAYTQVMSNSRSMKA
jgi:hypothetical protein